MALQIKWQIKLQMALQITLQIKVRRKEFYFEIVVQSDFRITETSLYVNGSQINPVNATNLVKIC